MEHTTTHHEHHYAGFWIRCAARFIDGLIVGVALVVINLVLNAVFGRGNIVAPVLDIVGGFAYFCYMTKEFGATYGKKALGIHVIAVSGTLSWGVVFMREVLGKIVSGIILDIGYLMVAFTSNKQGLHDKIANTIVVYKDPSKRSRRLAIALNIVFIALVILALMSLVTLALATRHVR